MPRIQLQAAQNHMNTTFVFTVSCQAGREIAARETLAEAHRRIDELEDELTEFREPSAVYRVNQAETGARIAAAPSVIELLDRAESLRRSTAGAFDCLAKAPALNRIGWDANEGTIWREGSAHLSFGAIGKGYALDAVRSILELQGFSDYFLSAGGSSLVLSGHANPGEPWRFGWSWSKDTDGDALGIRLRHDSGRPIAIGVSGTHEKGEHIFDPRTGKPATANCLSALVAHSRATEADALSTALFVGGWDEARQWQWDWNGEPALAVLDAKGVPYWNKGFQRLWGSLEKFVPQ